MKRVPRPCRSDPAREEKTKNPKQPVKIVRNFQVNNAADSAQTVVNRLHGQIPSSSSVLPERINAKDDKRSSKVIVPSFLRPLDRPDLLSVHRVGEDVLEARSKLSAADAASREYARSGGEADLAGLAAAQGVELLGDSKGEVAAASARALRALNFGPDEQVFGSNLQSLHVSEREFIKSLSKPRHKRTAIPPSTKRDPVPSLGEDFGFFPHQGEDIVPDLGVDEKKREQRREEAARRRMKEKYSYEELCERDREWGQRRFYRKN